MLTLIVSRGKNDNPRLISHQALGKPSLIPTSLCYHLGIDNLNRQIEPGIQRAQLVDLGELLLLVSHFELFDFLINVSLFESDQYRIKLRIKHSMKRSKTHQISRLQTKRINRFILQWG